MEFKFKHDESGEIKTLVLSAKEIQELLEDELHEYLECGCEPVGETYVVECGCEDYFDGFYLQERVDANEL